MIPKSLISTVVGLTLLLAFLPDSLTAEPYTRHENIVYKVEHGIGLILDVFVPTGEKNGLAIVDTLSGAWHSGQAQIRDHLRGGIFDIYCGKGYTVFMIRPGSRTKFTADEMVVNLKTGIRWVKEHAEKYKIDPERLGITGASAGGHLTLLTTALVEEGDVDANNPLHRHGTDVKAVAVFFPPTDFLDYGGRGGLFGRLGDILFACGIDGREDSEVREKAEAISPAWQAKKGFPPTLLIHGDADPAVPLQQSERMVEVLKGIGTDVELIVKEGGAHPWPTIPEEVAIMGDWFDKKLRE